MDSETGKTTQGIQTSPIDFTNMPDELVTQIYKFIKTNSDYVYYALGCMITEFIPNLTTMPANEAEGGFKYTCFNDDSVASGWGNSRSEAIADFANNYWIFLKEVKDNGQRNT